MDLTSYLMGKKSSGGGSSSGVAKFSILYDDTLDKYVCEATPQDVINALKNNGSVLFYEKDGDFEGDEFSYSEYVLSGFSLLQIASTKKYYLTMYMSYIFSDESHVEVLNFEATTKDTTFIQS